MLWPCSWGIRMVYSISVWVQPYILWMNIWSQKVMSVPAKLTLVRDDFKSTYSSRSYLLLPKWVSNISFLVVCFSPVCFSPWESTSCLWMWFQHTRNDLQPTVMCSGSPSSYVPALTQYVTWCLMTIGSACSSEFGKGRDKVPTDTAILNKTHHYSFLSL